MLPKQEEIEIPLLRSLDEEITTVKLFRSTLIDSEYE